MCKLTLKWGLLLCLVLSISASISAQSINISNPVYGNDPGDEDAIAAALNDAWETGIMNACAGEFTTVYGDLSTDVPEGSSMGMIMGLVDGVNGLAMDATFDVVDMDGPAQGTVVTTCASGDVSTSGTMQDISPKPTGITEHFTENCGSNSNTNAILITFPQGVCDVGFWLGDVESSGQDGELAEIQIFTDGDVTTPTAMMDIVYPEDDNMNDGVCGSNVTGFPSNNYACGDNGTIWVDITSAATGVCNITSVLIIVGDDDPCNVAGSDCNSMNEHLSFAGVTIGGSCLIPSISIDKNSLDLTDLQTIEEGESVEFEITVTNDGNVPLTNVMVTDPLSADCDNTIGDLAIGESVTYTCTLMNVLEGFTNEATVTGTPDGGGDDIDDTNTSEVVVTAVAAVPTLSEWGMILLGLLILSIGLVYAFVQESELVEE